LEVFPSANLWNDNPSSVSDDPWSVPNEVRRDMKVFGKIILDRKEVNDQNADVDVKARMVLIDDAEVKVVKNGSVWRNGTMVAVVSERNGKPRRPRLLMRTRRSKRPSRSIRRSRCAFCRSLLKRKPRKRCSSRWRGNMKLRQR